MRTEAKRSMKHGFILNEAELRRFVDVMHQQIKRVGLEGDPVFTLKIKFKNGTISEVGSLDEVLSLENFGSRSVMRLEMNLRVPAEKPLYEMMVEFSGEGEEDGSGIRYTIVGEERDWVFVTSSEFDERITKMKTIAPKRFIRSSLFTPVFVLCMMIGMFVEIRSGINSQTTVSSTLEAARKAGKLSDPVDAIILLEKTREASQHFARLFIYPVAMPLVMVLLLYVAAMGLTNLYPGYNFCWGDYLRYFDKKRATRKFVFIVVLTGCAVSIVGGVIANMFQWKH